MTWIAALLHLPAGGGSIALAGALALGLTGSLHCFAMCGPLACSALPGQRTGRRAALVAYHLGRSATYALEGGLVGALGEKLFRWVPFDLRAVSAGLVVALLLASAFDLFKRLPSFAPLRRLSLWVARSGAALPAWGRAGALGIATGLLPCGLLYAALGIALAASSFFGGVLAMLVFALASGPALLLAQLPFAAAFRAPRLGPWLRRGAPLIAAILVVLRTVGAPAARVVPNPGASMERMKDCPMHR